MEGFRGQDGAACGLSWAPQRLRILGDAPVIGEGTRILSMDSTWTPERWLSIEEATALLTRGLVHYSLGDRSITLRGGINAKSGAQSLLEVKSILVTNTRGRTLPRDWAPPVTRELLIHRDRHLCGFCGVRFSARHLTIDHIVPQSRGGRHVWTNIVAACSSCNTKKRDRTPEQARMPLLFVPYVPNRFEQLIIENRNCLADQMEFLIQRVPKHSRLIS
ncbi:MAG: HNH endonuclease [Betaproteobacteria bacterium]